MAKILRVFPRRTAFTPRDELAFVGDPPLFRPAMDEVDEVHISVTFTWDIAEGQRLANAWQQYYPVVKLGGPALSGHSNGFVPGRYIRSGVTFTTRGCNNYCPWCLVPSREGRVVEITDFAEGYIVQDNNLLQASQNHICQVLNMLRTQPRAAVFSGGLQASLISDWFIEELRNVRINQLFLAADTESALKPLERALRKLAALGLGRRKLRVYVLIGYNGEILADAEWRLKMIWKLGCMPFAQLFQPPDCYINYSDEWRQLARLWSRPAIMMARFGE